MLVDVAGANPGCYGQPIVRLVPEACFGHLCARYASLHLFSLYELLATNQLHRKLHIVHAHDGSAAADHERESS